MKKLMIALAAVAMAAGVQAANVDWKINYAGNLGGSTAYVFNSANKDAVLALFDNFTTSADVLNYALKAGGDVVSSTGVAIQRGTWTTSFAEKTVEGVTESDSVFAVIFNGDIATGTSYIYTGDTSLEGFAYDPPGGGNSLNWDATKFTGSGTITGGPSPVPEPTSGLLLLLGVAGLALKRRRV